MLGTSAGAAVNVIVTGAAQGIGEGVARHLAEEGHRRVLADIQADTVAAIARVRDGEVPGLGRFCGYCCMPLPPTRRPAQPPGQTS